MATRKEYVTYVLEQLSGLEGIRSRAMMGEYLLYYQDRLFGGIYDNRFLVKPVPAAIRLMPDAPWEVPYSGAKEMLLVEQVDDRAFLETLLPAMYSELPEPKKKKKKA